tara:strand:+ start:7589 stop:8950 length:1362 start_codon:yes stop_codon:yes gene_type:complete
MTNGRVLFEKVTFGRFLLGAVMADSVFDVVVIGAGPGGLILTRRLAESGVNFVSLERNGDVGGIWDIDAPGSPMYESAHFISSRSCSGFPGFPMPENFPDYPGHRQLLSYIRSYADHHDLRKHIRFNTEVVKTSQNDDGLWQLQLSGGEVLQTRYLICANGVTWEPNIVEWPGEFSGEIRHSVSYRSPQEFAGKRVLVVGCGNSGVDIACDAAFAADQAFLSTRRGYHFLPKHLMGIPSDVLATKGPKLPFRLQQMLFGGLLRLINGKPEDYGLPTPDHKIFESHPLMNTQILHYIKHGDCIPKPGIERFEGDEVVFTDGSREQIDLVIAATGYQHASPFLPEDAWEDKGGRPDLYLRIFSKRYNNLAVLGFVEFASAAYASFDEMAELIVADATATKETSLARKLAEKKQHHNPDLKAGHRYIATPRHANYVDVDRYLKVLGQVKRELGVAS